MINDTRMWGFKTTTPTNSEAIQRIAFSFGYSWNVDPHKVSFTDAEYLTFDPEHKVIYHGNHRGYVENCVCKIVDDFSTAIELFKNPPAEVLQLGDFSIAKNGDVTIYKGVTKTVIFGNQFDEVVAKRNEFIGRVDETPKQRLPLVQFTYTNINGERKLRSLLVKKEDNESISGFDVDANNQFKTFLRKKIIGPIVWIGFSLEP